MRSASCLFARADRLQLFSEVPRSAVELVSVIYRMRRSDLNFDDSAEGFTLVVAQKCHLPRDQCHDFIDHSAYTIFCVVA